MASASDNRGNCEPESPNRLFPRDQMNEVIARHLGIAMRASKKMTNEVVARLSGVPERRIEKLRSLTEEVPDYLGDVLAIASVLERPIGVRFMSGILSEIDMYAAPYEGASPEKIGAEIIELAAKLTGAQA